MTSLADLVCLVGLDAVQRSAVFEGVDRHRLNAQLGRRSEGSNGNLAAVRD